VPPLSERELGDGLFLELGYERLDLGLEMLNKKKLGLIVRKGGEGI
jgi:hypothetical protein